MKYMGSKNRIAKYIIPIMLAHRSKEMPWVEPFVGGANIIDKVGGDRIGCDLDLYLIEALTSIRDFVDELPKNNLEFTESDYKRLRTSDDYQHKGYAGFAFSYGAKWLGGWRRDKTESRDYVGEAFRNALKQTENIQGVLFKNESYQDLEFTVKSLIYCDPPYDGVTSYRSKFNHKVFWEWCRDRSKDGHVLFVSEYSAPSDFECLWERELSSSLTKDTGSKKAVEKLFRFVAEER